MSVGKHPDFAGRLRTNLSAAHKMASNWVMASASTAAAIYLSLAEADRLALIAGVNSYLHIPAWLIPVVVGLAGFVARVWPQQSITRPEAVAKSAAP